MTQEDKDLLLIDLSARLPYHVRCKIWLKDGTTEEGLLDLKHNYGDVLQDAFYYNKIKDIKPYLRPMSSMTKDEVNEYRRLKNLDWQNYYNKRVKAANKGYWLPEIVYNMSIDYLNSIHIDYRDLIEKGFAIEAPKGMYDLKEK